MATGYPQNWPEIAQSIKEQARWQCEHCGHPHDVETGHVLTVHHLDMDPSNCDFSNLVALCQRCHLSIQATYKPGQTFMFGKPLWAEIRGL